MALKLAEAARRGMIDLVQGRLETATQEEKNDALYMAVKMGRPPTVDLLLKEGGKPTAAGLLHALQRKQYTLAETLVDHGAPSDRVNGTTPLIYAVRENYVELFTKMLEKGADLTMTDNKGRNALHYAARENHPDVLSVILEKKSSDEEELKEHVRHATYHGHQPVLKVLLGSGTGLDANTIFTKGNRPLLIHAIDKCGEETVKTLLECGADPNVEFPVGRNAIDHAVAKKKANMGSLLINSGGFRRFTEVELHNVLRSGNWPLFEVACEANEHAGGEPVNDEVWFITSAKSGSTTIMAKLLEQGTNINAVDVDGRNALHYAIQGRKRDTVVFLLQNGINTTIEGDALVKLIKGNEYELLEVILRSLPNWNAPGREALNNALLMAAKEDSAELVSLLIEFGADVNYASASDGRTALMNAAQRGDAKIVARLIDLGADVNKQKHFGHTALMWTAQNGHIGVMLQLIRAGANVELRAGNKMTACELLDHRTPNVHKVRNILVEALENNDYRNADLSYFPQAVRVGYKKHVWDELHDQMLLSDTMSSKNAEEVLSLVGGRGLATRWDYYGRTLLMFCAYKGYTAFVHHLLLLKANTRQRDHRGMTALIWAVLGGAEEEMLNHLLEFKSPLDMADDLGRTALHCAIRKRDEYAATFLAKAGGTLARYQGMIMRPHELHQSVLWATHRNFAHIVRALLEAGMKVDERDSKGRTPLMLAAAYGYSDLMVNILAHYPNINAEDNAGRTPLWHALHHKRFDTFEQLLKAGASKEQCERRRSPLCVAAQLGRLQFVTALIEHGARPELQEEDGTTALMHACRGGYDEIAHLLIGKISGRATNLRGECALHYAVERNNLKLVKALLDSKVDVNQRDIAGRTPLHMAAAKCSSEVVSALLFAGASVERKDGNGANALGIVLSGEISDPGRAETAQELIAWGADCEQLAAVAAEVEEYINRTSQQ